MAKYLISTNLDKLPAHIIAELVEAGCSIEKYQEPAVTPTTEYQNTESSSSSMDAEYGKLVSAMTSFIATAKTHGVRIGYNIETLQDYINKRNYDKALHFLGYVSREVESEDAKVELIKVSRHLGNLAYAK